MTWGDVSDAAKAAQDAQPRRRIVRVYCDDARAPDLWLHDICAAPVVKDGGAALAWNDGTVDVL